MNSKTEYLIEKILKKLKNNKSRSIDIEKHEFIDFLEFLINKS